LTIFLIKYKLVKIYYFTILAKIHYKLIKFWRIYINLKNIKISNIYKMDKEEVLNSIKESKIKSI